MRRWAFRLAAVLLGLAVPLAIAEAYLRVTGSGGGFYEPDPILGARLIPNSTGRWRKACFDVPIQISAQGLRDVEHPLEKPPDVQRIAVLGDSIVEALQVPLAETFPRLLEAYLNAGNRAARAEAINFGVSGYGTDQMYLTLKTRAAPFKPDVVVLAFTIGNDVRNNFPALERQLSSYPKPFFRLDGTGGLAPLPFQVSAPSTAGAVGKAKAAVRRLRLYDVSVAWARAHPAAFSFLEKLGLAQGAPAPAGPVPPTATGAARIVDPQHLDLDVYRRDPDPEWAEAWRVTEALIRATRDEAKRLGARFLLAAVPGGVELAPPEDLAKAFPHYRPEFYDLAGPRHRLRQLADTKGIGYVSVFDALAADQRARNGKLEDYFFRCDGHLTPRAHEIMARAIADALRGGAGGPRFQDGTPGRRAAPSSPGGR